MIDINEIIKTDTYCIVCNHELLESKEGKEGVYCSKCDNETCNNCYEVVDNEYVCLNCVNGA